MRTHEFTNVASLSGSYRMLVDLPGWSTAKYATLTQIQTFISGHAAVTLGASTNGLSLVGQCLSLAVFVGTTAGAVPAAPVTPHSGKVLNSLGGWTEVISPPPGGGSIAVMKPTNDIDYVGVGVAGAIAFNVTSGNPLGTATLYSGTPNSIRTASKLTADLGLKAGAGITILEITDEATYTMTATGKYLALNINNGATDKVVYVPTYELSA